MKHARREGVAEVGCTVLEKRELALLEVKQHADLISDAIRLAIGIAHATATLAYRKRI